MKNIYLENLIKKYNKKYYIKTDPVKYVYYYTNKLDKEFIAFIVALFSYGNIRAMFKFLNSLITFLGKFPVETILNFNNKKKLYFYYRFQNSKDIEIIFYILKEFLYTNRNKNFVFIDYFIKNQNIKENNIYSFIDNFLEILLQIIPKKFLTNGIKHYFSLSPGKTVAKRYCLFFRWMVRKQFPDFGIYHFIQPSQLIYPVDTHILNFSYKTKIINSKNLSRKTAIEITNYFKTLNPEDPLVYDFFLTRELMLKNTFHNSNIFII